MGSAPCPVSQLTSITTSSDIRCVSGHMDSQAGVPTLPRRETDPGSGISKIYSHEAPPVSPGRSAHAYASQGPVWASKQLPTVVMVNGAMQQAASMGSGVQGSQTQANGTNGMQRSVSPTPGMIEWPPSAPLRGDLLRASANVPPPSTQGDSKFQHWTGVFNR